MISDQLHSGGKTGFFWLPPLVANPARDGVFDGMQKPVVTITPLQPGAAPIATFTTTTGPGSETVRVDPAAETYIVNWHTKDFDLDPAVHYRIAVLLGGQVSGFLDVDVVPSQAQAKNVDTGAFIPLVDGRTLPIKWWLNGCGATFCNLANAASKCVPGTGCVIVACNPGFADCDGTPGDGCEINTTGDPQHCAGCGRRCAVPNATAACAASTCAVGACTAPYLDCNGSPGDGCEVKSDSDNNHCGGCGVVCNSKCQQAPTCQAGVCAGAPVNCDDGNPCTDDSCDPATGCKHTDNTAPCNDGNACTTADTCAAGKCVGGPPPDCRLQGLPAHMSGTCARLKEGGSACVAICDPGFGDCDGDLHNGCEVDLRSDVLHCGACATACAAPPPGEGVAACGNGACGVACPATGCTLVGQGPLAGLKVEVPEGAVPPGTVITAAVPSAAKIHALRSTISGQFTPIGQMLELLPHGVTFYSPVTVTFPALPSLPANAKPMILKSRDGAAWQGLNPTVDGQGNVSVKVREFSFWITSYYDEPSFWVWDGGVRPAAPGESCLPYGRCDVARWEFHPGIEGWTWGSWLQSWWECGSWYSGYNFVPCQNGQSLCREYFSTWASQTCYGDWYRESIWAVLPAYECVHSPLICASQNGCEQRSCLDGECVVTADTCAACSSNDGCQVPYRDAQTNQCATRPKSCDDADACTAESCQQGACGHAPVNCSDNNACTADSCDRMAGCQHTAIVCNDNQASTADSCNPQVGCVYEDCDDRNACTTDSVNGPACGHVAITCSDGDPCTDDTCDPIAGCRFPHNTAPCDDGNACTTQDRCNGGACGGGAPRACDDGNGCTNDSCNPASGCVHANNSAACDDGNVCTTGDVCQGGACRGSGGLDCDDHNPCTTDGCGAQGCTHLANTLPCNDGNACTTQDACSAGACAGGVPLGCDDGNVCTTDSCNPQSGCGHVNNTAACNDGNACTIADVCSGGACGGGATLVCNDGNACTSDGCNPASGCTTTPLTCNDNNSRTSDSCNPASGCQYAACGAGTADCDGSGGNGCETNTQSSNSHCGACGQACGGGQTCQGGACAGGGCIVGGPKQVGGYAWYQGREGTRPSPNGPGNLGCSCAQVCAEAGMDYEPAGSGTWALQGANCQTLGHQFLDPSYVQGYFGACADAVGCSVTVNDPGYNGGNPYLAGCTNFNPSLQPWGGSRLLCSCKPRSSCVVGGPKAAGGFTWYQAREGTRASPNGPGDLGCSCNQACAELGKTLNLAGSGTWALGAANCQALGHLFLDPNYAQGYFGLCADAIGCSVQVNDQTYNGGNPYTVGCTNFNPDLKSWGGSRQLCSCQ